MFKNEILKTLALNLVSKKENETHFDCLRKNIFMYLDHKDITIYKLAEAANISVDTLKTLLYGSVKDCKLSTVIGLAKALNITVDELVGNMEKKTSESLRTYSNLPHRSQKLIQWFIEHEKFIHNEHPEKKIISVIHPTCSNNGNLKLNHDYEMYDISDIGSEYHYKIYVGVVIPCHHYMPHFLKGDLLLIANDREAKSNEQTVVIADGNVYITKRVIEDGQVKYYGTRDGYFRHLESQKIQVLGYVAKIIEAK